MNNIEINHSVFESIKHIDEYGNEYWYARELQKVLKYSKWQKFKNVIDNAKKACKNSIYSVLEQFTQVGKLSKKNNNATTLIEDYKLSRYSCHLIAQIC